MVESLAEAAEARAAFKLPKKLVEDLDRFVMTYIDLWIDRCRCTTTITNLPLPSLPFHVQYTQQHKNSVATLDGGLQLADVKVAGDGTRKLVLEITSGAGKPG